MLCGLLFSLIGDSLFIIHQLVPFVKHFFSSFFETFFSHGEEAFSEKRKAEKEGFEPSRRANDLHP